MCGVIIFSALLVATPQVNAILDPDSKARIYAAYNTDPPQLQSEINAANWVAGQIEAAFEASGYSADNLTGESTNETIVLANAENDEDEYDRVAVFHFGHMAVGFNLGYQDNTGANISAAEIDSKISSTKYDFVFLWVCAQAQWYNSGMPVAWTSRTDLSHDGYHNPDNKDQVYIGFKNFSPQINNTTAFEGQTTDPLCYWIKDFYDYALRDSHSVKDSINLATTNFFGTSFTLSILNTGYSAWWSGIYNNETGEWEDQGYKEGQMRVFGDGNMFVFQPTLTISAGSGGYVTPSGTYRYTYGHNAIACAYPYDNYNFYEWKLDGQHYSWEQCVNVWMDDNHNLQSIFTYVPPPQYSLTISAGYGGTTSPSPGTYWYDAGTNVQVQAYATETDYDFDHWNLDGGYYSSNPTVTVTMNSNHNLDAIFTYNPPETHQLTVLCYDQYGWPGSVPLYIDGEFVGYTLNTYTVTEGDHTLYVPPVVGGYYYFYGWYDGSWDYNNPTTVGVYSDKTVTAYYTLYR
jgi:hypothetical protein